MLKNLSLIINTNQIFISHIGDDAKTNAPILNTLFENISDIYIPLLNMFETLEKSDIPCKIGIVLPPILCNLLTDSNIQSLYEQFLDSRILLGQDELKRCSNDSNLVEIVNKKIQKFSQLKSDFTEKYARNLIKAFREKMEKGYLEILATCGTDIYIPHYADLKEIISAQIECGLHSYRQFFGEIPDGFWLPELGYTPGVEKLIRAYGYTYTVLDARSLLLSQTIPEKGLFYPVRTDNSLVVFGADPEFSSILFGEDGYAAKECYLNYNHDIGFELTPDELKSVLPEGATRISTGYKYWNKNFEEEALYDENQAFNAVKEHAKDFITKLSAKLTKAAELCNNSDYVCNVCVLDADIIKQNWTECILWIEQVIRQAIPSGINMAACNEMLENQYNLEKIQPYYSSAAGEGYGENLLSSKNCWMMRYARKASERMVDLSDRFPTDTGLKTRLLNLGAKELMLAQSSILAKMIENDDYPEFAERRFKESIEAFTAVFDSLGSNTVSTEWLTTLETKDSIFPWMNYRIFSKKR